MLFRKTCPTPPRITKSSRPGLPSFSRRISSLVFRVFQSVSASLPPPVSPSSFRSSAPCRHPSRPRRAQYLSLMPLTDAEITASAYLPSDRVWLCCNDFCLCFFSPCPFNYSVGFPDPQSHNWFVHRPSQSQTHHWSSFCLSLVFRFFALSPAWAISNPRRQRHSDTAPYRHSGPDLRIPAKGSLVMFKIRIASQPDGRGFTFDVRNARCGAATAIFNIPQVRRQLTFDADDSQGGAQCKSSHRATARALQHARSPQRVHQATIELCTASQHAPTHNFRDSHTSCPQKTTNLATHLGKPAQSKRAYVLLLFALLAPREHIKMQSAKHIDVDDIKAMPEIKTQLGFCSYMNQLSQLSTHN